MIEPDIIETKSIDPLGLPVSRTLFFLLLLLAFTPASWARGTPSTLDRDITVSSAALGKPLRLSVYLPPGYATGTGRYPVLYLLHGAFGISSDWLTDGRTAETTDRLIDQGLISPMILVMPEAGNSWYADSAEIGGPGNFETAIGRDLVDGIDARYRTAATRNGRAIAGISMGGFGALAIAFQHPDRFAAAASLSGAFWIDVDQHTRSPELIRNIFDGAFGDPFDRARFLQHSPMGRIQMLSRSAVKPALYLTAGSADRFQSAREASELHARLMAAGIPATLRITGGDHDWDTWADVLPDVLSFVARNLGVAPTQIAPGETVSHAARPPSEQP